MSEFGPLLDRDPLPLEMERQVDRLSDEFERAWKAGRSPRIEDYLDRAPAAGRTRLLDEILAVEFDLLEQQGQSPDVDAYRQRFPGMGEAIDGALHRQGQHEQVGLSRSASGGEVTDGVKDQPPDPAKIGRFSIRRRLGQGGFGIVYLAHDPASDRLVALKVPRSKLFAADQQRENFLQEARAASALKHSGLVVVHEVQQEGKQVYIVQEYIDGQNLAQWAAVEPRSWQDIARCMIEIVTAIAYVHQQGFYHRDLKPGNILVDKAGHAHVADFGLAVHEDALRMLKGKVSGTPRYMSPEQCRGETHWIDGRTDIWALGVVLYELLAGRRPFAGDSVLELFDEIQERDPKPPRTRNPEIPKELERICLKCLAKRRTQRYTTAWDLLEDLQAFLATCPDSMAAAKNRAHAATAGLDADKVVVIGSPVPPGADGTRRQSTQAPDFGPQPPLRIVPKGLRSFDKEDKDFFLDLLPGPRDREGLPDMIRFWKTRIEETDADATFAVGVMYGPSGCGKSSLVKAGLLPRLASHVIPIFVEATPGDTERRLLKTLQKQIPGLAAAESLAEALAQLREGRVINGRKVLLVVDQFEQWLHAANNMDSSQLVRALRQCDGGNVQCLLLVRDDFWLSTTRFMHALEIPLLEGVNSALVDLFDEAHARTVLRAFGLAYGRLPECDLSADQLLFLDRAVEELAHDGKVVCVQLSLLAEMMKGRPWTSASLQELGGMSGLGVAFLEETFAGQAAPPTHRLHAQAARALLKALLPEVSADIKGQMQPAERLLDFSGYANRPEDFRDLLQILNHELRLITPTEPEQGETEARDPTSPRTDQQFYQLTHDYLVPSLREWLTRKQKETRRGRAELKLAERAAMWNTKPENRHFPSVWEYGNIRIRTRWHDWDGPQRTMMRRAGRYHAMRWATSMLAALFIAVGVEQAVSRGRLRNLSERLRTAVATMRNSRGPVVPLAIHDLTEFPSDMALDALNSEFANPANTGSQKLAITFALAKFGQVNRPFLLETIPTASKEEVDNLATALAHDQVSALQYLRAHAVAATLRKDWQHKTRLGILAMYLSDPSIAAEMLQGEPTSADPQPWDPIQRTMFIEYFSSWSGSVEKLADVLRTCTDKSLRSGMCLAIGSVREPSAAAKAVWQEVWAHWHESQPDSGTHSATWWALRTWSLTLPEIRKPWLNPERFDWQLTNTGLTMIRIPAGETERPSDPVLSESERRLRVESEFWLSDREISVGLYLTFLNDESHLFQKPEVIVKCWDGRDKNQPVMNVSWYDAVLFCNWLNYREGYDPCYTKAGKEQVRNSDDNRIEEHDAWKLIPGVYGYRLPTEDQWEYACRARTTTAYCYGDTEDLLDHYAVFLKNSKMGPDLVGRRLCNVWGLFDMHGNVYEWCQDWLSDGSLRVYRGGSWGDGACYCRSAYRYGHWPGWRMCHLGFRVAAALPASPARPAGGVERGREYRTVPYN